MSRTPSLISTRGTIRWDGETVMRVILWPRRPSSRAKCQQRQKEATPRKSPFKSRIRNDSGVVRTRGSPSRFESRQGNHGSPVEDFSIPVQVRLCLLPEVISFAGFLRGSRCTTAVQCLVGEQPFNRVRHRSWVLGRNEQPRLPMINNLGYGTARRGDDWDSACHRFRNRKAERLRQRGVHVDICGLVERGHLPGIRLERHEAYEASARALWRSTLSKCDKDHLLVLQAVGHT